MRPDTIDDYVGQDHIIGKNTILRQVLDKNEVPSMILWGPPGCGKVCCQRSKIAHKTMLTFQFISDNFGPHYCKAM